jgi:hypothetical protein
VKSWIGKNGKIVEEYVRRKIASGEMKSKKDKIYYKNAKFKTVKVSEK